MLAVEKQTCGCHKDSVRHSKIKYSHRGLDLHWSLVLENAQHHGPNNTTTNGWWYLAPILGI